MICSHYTYIYIPSENSPQFSTNHPQKLASNYRLLTFLACPQPSLHLLSLLLDHNMDNMRSMMRQLVCLLSGLLDYSISPLFILVLAFHLVPKLAGAIVLSFLLLLLELPESFQRHQRQRIRRIRTCRPLHRNLPPTSRLLLIPPKLQQMIWTMLLREFELVHVRERAPTVYTSYADFLRLYMGKNSRYSTSWFSRDSDSRPLQSHISAFLRP